MTDSTETVTLSKPLKTHSGEVTSLTLKEPEARSFFTHGEPFKVRVISDEVNGDRIDFDFNNAVFKNFLADMTGHDDIVLGKLRAADFMTLRSRAAQMIIGVAGTNPTAT
jgi:hypothetical protein